MWRAGNMQSIGIGWNSNLMCANMDLSTTLHNQLDALTGGVQSIMGSVIQNATGAVASLPELIIQRADPGLYNLLTNGDSAGSPRLRSFQGKLSRHGRTRPDLHQPWSYPARLWLKRLQRLSWGLPLNRGIRDVFMPVTLCAVITSEKSESKKACISAGFSLSGYTTWTRTKAPMIDRHLLPAGHNVATKERGGDIESLHLVSIPILHAPKVSRVGLACQSSANQ